MSGSVGPSRNDVQGASLDDGTNRGIRKHLEDMLQVHQAALIGLEAKQAGLRAEIDYLVDVIKSL